MPIKHCTQTIMAGQ